MSISIKPFLNGLSHRLKQTKAAKRFPALGWTKEKVLKHQDDTSIKQTKFGTLNVAYKRPYELLHTYKELFEDEIYFFEAETDTPFIVDCGANIGLSVLYFKRLYPQSTLLAYEPDAENLRLLEENIALNQLANVECRQRAVWINNEDLLFSSDGTQGSGIVNDGSSSNVIRMKAERLADLLQTRTIDFLKIDIEGAELDVIRDCAPFLGNAKNLFVEYHGKAADSNKLAEMLSILKNNFQVYIKLAADGLKHPFVEKTTGASFDVQLNIFCYPLTPAENNPK